MRAQFENAKITIEEDGSASMIMLGQARRIELQVVEETKAFIKIRMKGQSDGEPLVYDKTDETLMMPTNLVVNEAKGILPTYFRR